MTKDDKAAEQRFPSSLERFKQVDKTRRALLSSTDTWATNALRGLFVLHCGAVIAVLTHLDKVKNNPFSVYGFIRGAVFVVLSAGFLYLASFFDSVHYRHVPDAQLDNGSDNAKTAAIVDFAVYTSIFFAIMFFIFSCYLFMSQVRGIEQSLLALNATLSK